MKTISVSELQDQLALVLEKAQTQPVLVQGNAGTAVVILSAGEYAWLINMEDALWGRRADQALESGLLSHEETEAWLLSRAADWQER